MNELLLFSVVIDSMLLMLSVKLVLNPKHSGSSYHSVQDEGTMINHRYACIKSHITPSFKV